MLESEMLADILTDPADKLASWETLNCHTNPLDKKMWPKYSLDN